MTDVLSPAQSRSCGVTPTVEVEVGVRPQFAGTPANSNHLVRVAEPPERASERIQELELMRAVADHQAKAEAELVARIIGHVRTRARVLTRSRADADDATQTAIVEILRSAANFRGEGSLIGWCERITIRSITRQQRRSDRRSAAIDSTIDPDDVGVTASDPDLTETIPGGDVQNYLHELSDDRHRALVLRHVLGHSVEEIAEQTGVSANTVKDRLRMARKQVRQSIRQREVIAAVKARLT